MANGWVRCGRCGGVFEALLHLESDEAQEAQEAQVANAHDQNAVDVDATAQSITQPAASDIDAFHDSLMTFVPGGLRQSTSPSSDANDIADLDVPANAAAKASEQVSAQPVWLWVLATLLTLTGQLQLVLWNRHVLVAQEPALQGLIEGLCAPIGCEWHWPQTLEAVQIEKQQLHRKCRWHLSFAVAPQKHTAPCCGHALA